MHVFNDVFEIVEEDWKYLSEDARLMPEKTAGDHGQGLNIFVKDLEFEFT